MDKPRELFERVAGPLKMISPRLAVGRCPSCNEADTLFIDLKTGSWRCGRLPSTILTPTDTSSVLKSKREVKSESKFEN